MSACSGVGSSESTSVVAGLEYQTTEILLTDDRYDADRLKFGLTSGFGNPATFQYRNKTGVQPAATVASIPDPLCGELAAR